MNDLEAQRQSGLQSHFDWRNPLVGVPQFTKALCFVLFVFYMLGILFPLSLNTLALIPAFILPPHFYLWTLITSAFVETSLLNLLVNIFCVILFGRYLEPIWGTKEYTRFILVVVALTGIATFATAVVSFWIIGREHIVFDIYCGFAGVVSAFTVALKQLIPDQEMKVFFFFDIRTKHLPAIVLLVCFALYAFSIGQTTLAFTAYGIYFAWVYLRFFQRKSDIVGDPSDDFSFASFFPEPVQPFVGTFSDKCLRFAVALHCLPRAATSASTSAGGFASGGYVLGRGPAAAAANAVFGSDDDVERRRKITRGLRAVESRIAEMTKQQVAVAVAVPPVATATATGAGPLGATSAGLAANNEVALGTAQTSSSAV